MSINELAIEELKKDWVEHVRQARRGDARSRHAAREVYERMIELGCDREWLCWAKASMASIEVEQFAVIKGD